MSNLLSLKRRIKSAKNIAKITKAMEMVSASKMKKAQEQALNTRPFTDKLEEIITHLVNQVPDYHHPLTHSSSPSPKNIAVLVISTNKGLCGSLNANLFRRLVKWSHQLGPKNYSIIAVGKKAKASLPPYQANLLARFTNLSERPTFSEVRAITSLLIQEFTSGHFDQVFVAYPKFISTLKNEIVIKPLLPITPPAANHHNNSEYQIEPHPRVLLDELIPYQLEMTVYQTILEARASEHSARMVAMKNASENATDLIGSLTLEYNQARQSQVTNELLDAVSARLAIKE